MRSILQIFLIIILGGCTVNLTVHDEDRAAQIVKKFLTDIQTNKGIEAAYKSTHDKFKESVSFEQFAKVILNIRNLNSKSIIRIVGYETTGTEEVILIYAFSNREAQKIYYQFALVGTKYKDYSLYNINLRDHAFKTGGLYKEFPKHLDVPGV